MPIGGQRLTWIPAVTQFCIPTVFFGCAQVIADSSQGLSWICSPAAEGSSHVGYTESVALLLLLDWCQVPGDMDLAGSVLKESQAVLTQQLLVQQPKTPGKELWREAILA